MVDELSDAIHDLGISRFVFAQNIPADYESLETMIDTMGKMKRRSLSRSSDGTRLLPKEDDKAKIMDSLKFIFAVNEDFDVSILDGILEELPESINTSDDYKNLTG